MKKFTSLFLVLALILSVSTTLVGCRKKISEGTEAAKLLLANERLDENLIAQKIDVGLNSNLSAYSRNTVSALSYYASALSSDAAYSWSNFPAYNDTAAQFDAFLINIEHEAARVAEDIANMKNNVGVVDKWVKVGSENHMLSVYDTKDALFVTDRYDNVFAYYRYTDANANNVYEMFSFMKYDDGTTGNIRTMYIPGSRYEYQYVNSGGFEDYVIMENSRGYWVGNRYNYFSDTENTFVRFFPIIIKDNFCYSVTVEMRADEIMVYGYTVVDLQSGRELVTLGLNEGLSTFTVHASGIKSGLVSVGADDYYVIDGAYHTAMLNELVTTSGVYNDVNSGAIPSDDLTGFSGGMISYDYGTNQYRGYISMTADTPHGTIDEAFTELSRLLDKYGLTLYRSVPEIREQIYHAYALGEDFTEVFEWNGYLLDSLSSFESARDVLLNSYSSARSDYEKIKNNASATGKQKLDKNAAFAPVNSIISTKNSYTGGTVTLGGTAVEITDTTLFESGKDYVLKVALSLCDESGTPMSVNTVALDGAVAVKVTYNGGAISLSVSGSFTVPKNLIAGDYALVVYVATADEEIRVSEMVKIGSFSTYDETLDSAAMDIRVQSVGDTLHFKYAIKNSYTVTVNSNGKKYTSQELTRLITVEILKKGAPFSGAVLEYENGEAVGDKASLGAGTYRMTCYLNTVDGLAQSYIYLVVN